MHGVRARLGAYLGEWGYRMVRESEAEHGLRVQAEIAALRHLVGALAVEGFSVQVVWVYAEPGRTWTPADALRVGDTFSLSVWESISRERGYVGTVLLIPGNGEDLISDWSWRETREGERMRAVLVEAGL